VHFARGNLAQAEKLVAVAWAISQHSEVGDHLGQIFEKQGRREDAIRLYAQAVSAEHAVPEAREHLSRLVGSDKVERTVADHRGELLKSRAIALTERGPAGKHADFLVLLSSSKAIEAVRFVEGDEEMRALMPALERMPVGRVFPDDQPARLLRRGTLTCSPGGVCSFMLELPDNARPVK